MVPLEGRQRIQSYGQVLVDSELQVDTIRSYLGILRRYFSYVLEHPIVTTEGVPRRLQEIYSTIDQPVSEFDMPSHSYDGERQGIPLDPERLYDFYSCLREHYLNSSSGWKAVRARNYALSVVAGESGLRADELLSLELQDLFFESNKIQTRFAKGTKGSGKRSRVTLFPPLARDTMRFYLRDVRPQLNPQNSLVFVTQSGNRMTYSNINAALKEMVRVVRKEGFLVLEHLSWHWFRRLFATRFVEQFPHRLSVLVELLGHTTPNTVHRYIRHSEAWVDEEIQKVLEGEKIWPSSGG